MFPSWRLHLHEARTALNQGRLDRACQVLARGEVRGFRQTEELTGEVAARFVARARQRLEDGDTRAGWHDLQLAEQLSAGAPGIDELRSEYAREALRHAADELAAGRTSAAQTILARLSARQMGGDSRRMLSTLADGLQQAERLLADGRGGESLQTVSLLGEQPGAGDGTIESGGREIQLAAVSARIALVRERCHQFITLSGELLAAMEESKWSEVLAKADQLLTIAPRDPIARRARREAWRAVGLDATVAFQPNQKGAQVSLDHTRSPRHTDGHDETMPGQHNLHRFLMWVDSVGGYLVVTDDTIVLGQPAGGTPIAVPIRADLSRRHAVLRREGGNYVLDPLGPVKLDGQTISGPTVLGSQHVLELGQGVRMEFSRPHALSATARLTPLSHHRTEPRADAVILMADSCVLGPQAHSHIRCREWGTDLVLIARGGELSCRSTAPLTVDGNTAVGCHALKGTSRIEGDKLAMSFEPL
jgi:hypothetical protein